MPRKLKPQKVDWIPDHIGGLTIHIMLDRDYLKFYGAIVVGRNTTEIQGTRSDKADECKRLTRLKLHELRNFEWERVIVVDYEWAEDRDRHHRSNPLHGASIKFSFQRLEISPKPGCANKLVKRKFDEDLSDFERERRILPGNGTIVSSNRDDIEDFFLSKYDVKLPYASATWDALNRLARIVKGADAQLEAMFKQDPKRLALTLVSSSRVPLLGRR